MLILQQYCAALTDVCPEGLGQAQRSIDRFEQIGRRRS